LSEKELTNYYESLAGKWLELLKEAAPRIDQVALIYAVEIVAENYFPVFDAAANVLGIKAIRTPYRNAAELERAIDVFAAEPNRGLLMVPPPPSGSNRALINRLALKHRLPTVYSTTVYAGEGGFMSYGGDGVEQFRTAASYIDHILRGAKISGLPVQFPTKYELVVNLKTAKAIGLEVPAFLQHRADVVIE
jgi:putative ABC transport system substrate-binding protein